MTALASGRNDGQDTIPPGLSVVVTARALETVQPLVHPALQLKSTTVSVLPEVSADSVPAGDLFRALPPQKPNASLVPSGENLGLTASMLAGQPVTAFGDAGLEGSYRLETDGGARPFLSPGPDPPC